MENALESLDLSVGLDLYVNETTAHCDYVLPVTTMYERDDFAVTFQMFQATPSVRSPMRWWPRAARPAPNGTSSST